MTEIKKTDKEHKISKAEMPNELRRTLLKTSWVVPVITVVSLPAHAQTSPSCSMADLVGDWTAKFSHNPDAIMNNFTLNADGTGSNLGGDAIEWTLSGNTVGFNISWAGLGVMVIEAKLGADCSTMSGTGWQRDYKNPTVTFTFNASKQ